MAIVYAIVARVFGRAAGLLAALALAITPVAVVVDRSNLAESILVLTMLAAAWAVTRAAETGRLRWLLLAVVFAGVGFNVKMLEAYLAVPALFLVYLVGAPIRWYVRLLHLFLAAMLLLVVSLSWVTAVDLTPAAQRPYVGSSGNNSELSLALGYNGLGRLTGNTFSFLRGGSSLSSTLSDLSPTNLGFTQGETGGPGVQRLINAELGGQTSWLLVLAVIGAVMVAWQKRPRWPLEREHQSAVLWAAWLLTAGGFFSIAGFFHAYYLAMLAPPVAALAGIGIVALWREYERRGWRGWTLPLSLLACAAVQAHILGYFPAWSRWMSPVVVGGAVVTAIVLAVLRGRRFPGSTRAIAAAAAGLGLLALLLPPFIWSEYSVAHASANMIPSAGPAGPNGSGFGPARFGAGRGRSFPGASFRTGRGTTAAFFRGRGGFGRQDGGSADANLVRYLETHQGTTTFLLATDNAGSAEPYILATGKAVMDLGGFSGGDRIVNVRQLAGLVSTGAVRYFLLSTNVRDRADIPGARPRVGAFSPRRFGGGFGGRSVNNDLTQWVHSRCTVVPASAYHASASRVGGVIDSGGSPQLYDCAKQARLH